MHNLGVRLHRDGALAGATRALACAWQLACGSLAAQDKVNDVVKRCTALCQVATADQAVDVVACTASVLDAFGIEWLETHAAGLTAVLHARAGGTPHRYAL